MAASYIAINTNQRLGGQLRSALDLFRQSKDVLVRLTAIMATQVEKDDYGVMEAQFGIPAGQGANVQSLVTGVLGAFASPDAQTKIDSLLNQMG